MVLEPVSGLVAGVLGVVILLKDDVVLGFVVVIDAFLKFILQDLDIKPPIHPPINLACIPNPFPGHSMQPHTMGDPPPNCPLSRRLFDSPKQTFQKQQSPFSISDPTYTIPVFNFRSKLQARGLQAQSKVSGNSDPCFQF